MKGETQEDLLELKKLIISIHSPMKGETVLHKSHQALPFFISIHSPMKGETWMTLAPIKGKLISIHSPMKGETIWTF